MHLRPYTPADRHACLQVFQSNVPEFFVETEVALDTSQHTRPFYERLGFRTVRVTPDAYAPGLHRYDMRLRKPAPEPDASRDS